jgi:DNA polymerase-1
MPVGAVQGFCNMLWKLLNDMKAGERPTHLAVIFDRSERTFRNEIYPEYKAHRPPAPEDLVPQFAMIREATRAFGVPAVDMEGFEADDLIATYARQAKEAGALVQIVSSDKDLMQLIEDGRVMLFDPMKQKPLGPEAVFEKFGVTPDKVIDVQALMGDSVDNVPGAPGIGPKTAAELITTFGSLEAALERASEVKQQKRRETLIQYADQIRLSKELVTLKTDVAVEEALEGFAVRDFEDAVLLKFLDEMEFRTLGRRVREHMAQDPAAVVPKPAGAPEDEPPIDYAAYRTIDRAEDLQALVDRARAAGVVAVDTETTSLDGMRAKLVGVSLALGPTEAWYVPLGHTQMTIASADLFGEAAPETPGLVQIPLTEAISILKPLLEDPSVLTVGQNIKYDLTILHRHGIDVAPIDCTMLISYVLAAGVHGHGMDELSERFLGHKPIGFADVAGSGKAQVTFDRVPIEAATRYSAEDADVTLRLWRRLKPRLAQERLLTVYETLERPMPLVLAAMERAGIKVDPNELSRMSGEFAQRMGAMEEEAHKIAGKPFNLGSPKQIGDIFFGEMGLPGGVKTKTGAWSTDASVLEELAAQGHALPRVLLDWRQLQKLRSTYTEALRDAINPETGRVHTSFALAATTTGRLSSSDPNLQNIPIRTKEGREIRTAFVAPEGMKLISADYSQVELRLLAHIADIPALTKAFAEGIDIHAMTASEMFGVPVKGMPADVRSRAKAINFGIIYGISAFGLANQLSIPREEAGAYIKTYFERFPGIRAYMDRTKQEAHEKLFVTTIFGRKINLPDVNSSNPSMRAFVERAAINAPIQGSAADIIRRAMIRMPDALKAARLSGRMLLQVHDELVFEVPDAEVEKTREVVRKVMEHAAEPVLKLTVPLTVDAKAGLNWDEAH